MQVISKSGVSTLAVILALSCARPYPDPNTPSLVVPGAAIAGPGALHRTAGCWRLQALDWRATFLPDSTLLYLDTIAVRGQASQSAYAARVLSPPSHAILRAGWTPYGPGDSVYITVGTLYLGVRLRLGRAGDSLTGVGRNFSDIIGKEEAGPIGGARTSCVTRPPQN
jgi:hypothetical protein